MLNMIYFVHDLKLCYKKGVTQSLDRELAALNSVPAALVAVGLVARAAPPEDGLVGGVAADLLAVAAVLPVAEAVGGQRGPVAQKPVTAVDLSAWVIKVMHN